jgi:hypothetical protein
MRASNTSRVLNARPEPHGTTLSRSSPNKLLPSRAGWGWGHARRAFAAFTPTLALLRFKCSLVPRKQGREFNFLKVVPLRPGPISFLRGIE